MLCLILVKFHKNVSELWYLIYMEFLWLGIIKCWMLHSKNIKNMNTGEITFLQRKHEIWTVNFFTVQYVKKLKFDRLITFNINSLNAKVAII